MIRMISFIGLFMGLRHLLEIFDQVNSMLQPCTWGNNKKWGGKMLGDGATMTSQPI